MHDRAVNIAEQIWLLEPVAMRRLLAFAKAADGVAPDLAAHAAVEMPTAGMTISGSAATIPIKGYIMKSVPDWFGWFGIEATGTEQVRGALMEALADPNVETITLDIESPGGSVSGVAELADDIHAARGMKPIEAHSTDLMASAAYWIGAQADSITSNAMGATGSIGVYTYMRDFSEMMEGEGIKTHVVSSHELKGAGVEGSKVTDAQIADTQRLIDGYTDQFVSAVARGRGVSEDKAREWATGQVWLGAEAQKMGLIDTVRTTGTQSAAHNSTAPAATAASAKDTKNMEELEKELAALKAAHATLETDCKAQRGRADAAVEALSAIKAEQVTNLIEASTDRVTPALRASVEKYAEATGHDFATVKAFVDSLPVATRAEPQGSADGATGDTNAITEEDETAAAISGATPEEAAKLRVEMEAR